MNPTISPDTDTNDVYGQVPSDEEFGLWMHRIQARFEANVIKNRQPMFTITQANGFQEYLGAIPMADKQYHNCHACKTFLNRYGALVTISVSGNLEPVFWNVDDAPDYYKPAVQCLIDMTKRATIKSLFYTPLKFLGNDTGKPLAHFHLRTGSADTTLKKPYLAKSEFEMMVRVLTKFKLETIQYGVTMFTTGALPGKEVFLDRMSWLAEAAEMWKSPMNKTNRLWRMVAMAPRGYCNINGGILGTLLEGIQDGLSNDILLAQFKDKFNPLVYRRPQAPPAAGNIARAERVFVELGMETAIQRRFATMGDLRLSWITPPKPKEETGDSGSLFGHLKPKGETDQRLVDDLPVTKITWEKFVRTVLPLAKEISIRAPFKSSNYVVFTAPVHADAKPIYHWDHEDDRYPISYIAIHPTSTAEHWCLRSADWVNVSGITPLPTGWGVALMLEGAKPHPTLLKALGLGLFPAVMRSELNEVRATIEAHSNKGTLEGLEQANAVGLVISSNEQPGRQDWNLPIRVKSDTFDLIYSIDRWD